MKYFKKRSALYFLIFIAIHYFAIGLWSQETSVYTTNKNIYAFLDELANEKIIGLNSAVKPYSRHYVYKKLSEATASFSELNTRQQKELSHYLDYFSFANTQDSLPGKRILNLLPKANHTLTSLNHLGLYYSDSIFNFALRPIMGTEYRANETGDYLHTYRGLAAFASVGNHISLYADLRDNTINQKLIDRGWFSPLQGNIYKSSPTNKGSFDYSDMKGGIVLHGKYFSLGLVKDNIEWGSGYRNPIIHSGKVPSFPMIKLKIHPTKWLDFNYIHGWLISEVVDSNRSYISPQGSRRNVFQSKYIAANFFTIIPVQGLNFSFGNSIVYSDMPVNPAYLIPIMFYKSIDHGLTGYKVDNQNSQMFLDLSLRLVKHWHLYGTLFIDELAVKRITNPDEHNFYSYKVGNKLSNWPIPHIHTTFEYTLTSPITYKHRIPSLTYASNSYRMGHYLGANSEEIYFQLGTDIIARMNLNYRYSIARHGNEYEYESGKEAITYPAMQNITWSSEVHELYADFEFFTNCYLTFSYQYSNTNGFDVDDVKADQYLESFTPEFYQHKKNTIRMGFNVMF